MINKMKEKNFLERIHYKKDITKKQNKILQNFRSESLRLLFVLRPFKTNDEKGKTVEI